MDKHFKLTVGVLLILLLVLVGCKPAPFSETGDRTIAFIGDSIGGQAQPYLQPKLEALGRTSYTAQAGSPVWAHYDTIWRLENPVSVYVIELGSNDATGFGWQDWPDSQRFDYMLRMADERDPDSCVVVVPPVGARGTLVASQLAQAAAMWRQVAADHPHAHVTRWDSKAIDQATWFGSDSEHLSDLGARNLATHVEAAVRSYCLP